MWSRRERHRCAWRGSKESQSTAVGTRFSSQILCPAVSLFRPRGQLRLLLWGGMWSEGQGLYLESAAQYTRYKSWLYQHNWVLYQTRIDGWVWGQRQWQSFVQGAHCTDPCLGFGSPQFTAVVCVLWDSDVWVIRSRSHPSLLKAFPSGVFELSYRKKWHLTKQQILSYDFAFFINFTLRFMEVGSMIFIKDALVLEFNRRSCPSWLSSVLDLKYWTSTALFKQGWHYSTWLNED